MQSDGRDFYVVGIPTREASENAKRLLDGINIETIYLSEGIDEETYSELRFVNDANWNELGNIHAARALFQDIAKRELNHKEEEYLSEITRESGLSYAN